MQTLPDDKVDGDPSNGQISQKFPSHVTDNVDSGAYFQNGIAKELSYMMLRIDIRNLHDLLPVRFDGGHGCVFRKTVEQKGLGLVERNMTFGVITVDSSPGSV